MLNKVKYFNGALSLIIGLVSIFLAYVIMKEREYFCQTNGGWIAYVGKAGNCYGIQPFEFFLIIAGIILVVVGIVFLISIKK